MPLLIELLSPASVVDVGCGTAAWLEVFVEHGVEDVVGIDGDHIDRGQLRIPADRFLARDLAEPFELERTFDVALSLEAAHYAPEESAAGLVASIAALAPVVLFSAAIPGQGGGPGLNKQWPSYWGRLFAERGFRAWDWLRPQIWEDERVDWWYAQNAVLYAREERGRELGLGEPAPILPLVHPIHFLEVTERAPEEPPRRLFDRLRRK